ncbi:hypothetical protein Poli38472_003783 [Pythium oligandrum]|uniref:Uncharacterized protein n=1 Tax=Pythium oligandrum TaxID=41045 RepID=A0A8K1CN93_PYTOL|nr:hypothetical protein Poli38472_003783 [Pythium oligandrum]|eukprot:TMW66018.1 hypothetical protein Poli38472_003783 [Pythium oligandrum]
MVTQASEGRTIMMLRELETSLGNEREWHNIQKTVVTAFVKVVSVLSAQASEISALKEQLQRVEAARKKQEEEGKYITSRGLEKRCVALMRKWAEEHAADDLKTREVVKEAVAAERRKIEEYQCRLHEEWTSWMSKMEEGAKEMRQKWSDRSLRRTSDRKEDEFATRFDELESETRRLEDKMDRQFSLWRQEGVKSLIMKPDRAEVVSIIEEKTAEAVNTALQLKVTSLEVIRAELDQSKQQYKECYDAVRSLTESKAAKSDVTQLKTDLRDLLFVIEAMQREQGELREFVQPSNQRPRHQNDTDKAMARVNEALKQIQRSMEHTAKKGVVDDLMEQLTSVRRQLRSEMYQARYVRIQ